MATTVKWTPEKVQELRELAGKYSMGQIADLLDESVSNISAALSRFKIKGTSKATDNCTHFNWGNYPQDSIFLTYTDEKIK